MSSTIKIIKTISLIGALVFAATTVRAVSPPPDGGYANENTAEGDSALLSLTTGLDNTAIGFQALLANTSGGSNTANGARALATNTTGFANTATGFESLLSNQTGAINTAIGDGALRNNTTGSANTAIGSEALLINQTGSSNTALGAGTLVSNTGGNNTAEGAFALYSNSSGTGNTANGDAALINNTTGSFNTAVGSQALYGDELNFSTGSNNTGTGYHALHSYGTGNNNTANGWQALLNSTGSNNLALGASAGIDLTTGSDNIDLGNAGVAQESGVMRLGTEGEQTATFIAGIKTSPLAVAVAVGITSSGQLGVRASSVRFKEAIKPMDNASQAILSLRPVSFRYKKELDPDATPQFGLVAEEVAKVDPDLVVRDKAGKPFTVRYDEVNAMLLNEFLKAHHRAEQQDATISDLKSVVAKQQEQITALASQMQKVSGQLEHSRTAVRVVANNQ